MQIHPHIAYIPPPHPAPSHRNAGAASTPIQESGQPATDARASSSSAPDDHAAAGRGPRGSTSASDAQASQALSEAELRQVQALRARDREVRAHEQAHLAAAGGLAQGGPSFQYAVGPDGRRYAVGGEVQIATSPVANDPEATIAKARQIRRAALAPAEPSAQDLRVAAQASAMEQRAQAEAGSEAGRGAEAGSGDPRSALATEAVPSGSGVSASQAEERNAQGHGSCSICGGDHSAEVHNAATRERLHAAFTSTAPQGGLGLNLDIVT